MPGTILITGANSSLAIPSVKHLLAGYSDLTAVLTVRNSSDTDMNTNRLREIVHGAPSARVSIRQLDLADLSAVHNFAATLAADIASRALPPLVDIICNAFFWNLAAEEELTADGFEKTIQINHIAHVALVLFLLGSFSSRGGRVLLLASDAHLPGQNQLEQHAPGLPEDLDQLAKVAIAGDPMGRGFQRYANSKLAVVTWMYALNRRLQKVAGLSKITAVAMNPGNITDSRALQTNTPQFLADFQQNVLLQPLAPELLAKDPTLRTAAEAAVDLVEMATSKVAPGLRGYFTLVEADESSPESRDVTKQEQLWLKSALWANVTRNNTALGAEL